VLVEMEGQQLKTYYETKHSLIYCKTIFQCALQFASILAPRYRAWNNIAITGTRPHGYFLLCFQDQLM